MKKTISKKSCDTVPLKGVAGALDRYVRMALTLQGKVNKKKMKLKIGTEV
jgi:hypothetical protein